MHLMKSEYWRGFEEIASTKAAIDASLQQIYSKSGTINVRLTTYRTKIRQRFGNVVLVMCGNHESVIV